MVRARPDRSGDLVEVELDEGAAPSVAGAPRRPGPSTRVWQACAGLLALVLAGGSWADGARAADLVPAGPGLAGDLLTPRHEAWRVEGTLLVAVGDVAVVRDPDGTAVWGVALEDGTQRWRAAVDASVCGVIDLGAGLLVAGAPGAGTRTADARLYCIGAGPTEDGGSSVVVVDPSDGRVLVRTEEVDDAITLAGGLLVTGSGGADGSGLLSAAVLADGRVAWTHAAPSGWERGIAVVDGRVVVDGAATALDLRTGAAVDPPSGGEPEPLGAQQLADGSRVEWVFGARDHAPHTVVRGPDGATLWSAPGEPMLSAALDGSTTVPVRDDGGAVEVRDARTGDVLWTSPGSLEPRAAAAGVLVALEPASSSDRTQVVGRDERTGVVRWRLPAPTGAWDTNGLVSDGRRFLLPNASGDELEVRDVRDGSVVTTWHPPLPDGTRLHTMPGGRVAQTSGDEVVVLGW